MPVASNDLDKIEDWVVDILDELNTTYFSSNAPGDRTPELEDANRLRMMPKHVKGTSIQRIGTGSNDLTSKMSKSANLLNELFLYFQRGRRSEYNIDTLPQLTRDAFNDLLEHIRGLRG